MTKVKICGLRTVEHVETAVQHGVDFIGFVFAPSTRKITIEEAIHLARYIPEGVKKVGVFVNENPTVIQEIAKAVPLDYIQYHGDESNAFIHEIGLPSIKAFSIQTEEDVKRAATYDVDFYLFDAPGTDYRGGSGHTFDWSLLEAANIPLHKVILAGGLNTINVAQAISVVSPAAIDVSSGVEIEGIKDHALIETFLKSAKGAIV